MEFIDKELQSFAGKLPVLQTAFDVAGSLLPLWVAVIIGLIVGWSWKPRWVSLLVIGLRSRPRLVWGAPPGFGARRLWFALTALTVFQMLKELLHKFKGWKWPNKQLQESTDRSVSSETAAQAVVTEEDLKAFFLRLKCQDGGPAWQIMLERAIQGMSYQAWRREPQNGPTEYRSQTVFEDVTPEILRDYFWDDQFRPVWDDMLLYSMVLEECAETGAAIVHWVRKFPFFCSNREYIIGRRIWKSEGMFFCITKGVPYLSIPRKHKPRRVDTYYSSWCIRAVESGGSGQLTSCEVVLFHHEDMGIPKEIAKLGVRQGMWGLVKKMEPGLREYQAIRKSLKPLSRSALMAQINTNVPSNLIREFGLCPSKLNKNTNENKASQHNLWKWLIVGGAVALAFGLDNGVVGNVLVFGIGRKVGKLGRKLYCLG
eukprot:c25170_g1_i1 orf=635-1918(+)